MLQYFARPETPREDETGPELGPFPDFLQLTYDDLRSGPDGEIIAQIGTDQQWRFARDGFTKGWSDVVLYAKEV